ncbi:MAG: Invasion associated protein p60 [uncultured Sulfurovum sp.]|uniref:Invasion associated protein p60 n=1 Tax=uncultured Sulfurovum sp. TaxID=269237 RepID=A0A6S6SW28_9BACT|nr:MAG: Invasion associated protein p60 [uncultured Sulfurovum sp.]
MKNFKRFSATLFMAPLLFVGCVSEKTASIKPLDTEKDIVTLDANKTNLKEKKLLASAIFGGEISLNDTENNTNTDSTLNTEKSTERLTTQTLDLNKEWEAFTKEDEILETARKFLGVKYIWAANGPSAFDCSGFTKYVFKKSGISLPRYSGHQANIGKKIKFKDLEKGDLVFFDTEKKFTRRVNHVGIFIGNNKFIHASSAKKKVIITSFTKKKFYKNKFLYARRIINTNNSIALNTSLKQNKAFN